MEGLGERIIYRQLFRQGLTLFDSDEPKTEISVTHSHHAAREELKVLLDSLNLEGVIHIEQEAAPV